MGRERQVRDGRTARRAAWLVCGCALLMAAAVQAKDGGEQERIRFYGVVQTIPEGRLGAWLIGGRQVFVGPQTEFDELDGPLLVGGCAKVEIRDGVVHEIDSEPPHDCR